MNLALEASQISVSFGGVRACDEIDLTVRAGEVVGLTGPNGSGKSTFLNALNGLVPAEGELRIHGAAVELGRSRRVRDAGVIRTFQAPQNLQQLSCLENVMLSSPDRSRSGLATALLGRRAMLRAEKARAAAANVALDRVGLAPFVSAGVSVLTYGQQRLLELARAMAGEPSILMLDEPSAGLNASETGFLAEILTELRDAGVSIIIIDHKIEFLDRLSDCIVVLQLGKVIAEGPPSDIWQNELVVDAYLGRRSAGD